jgi:Arc/MetJ-type ribon-helix-helix transcriptional regulator
METSQDAVSKVKTSVSIDRDLAEFIDDKITEKIFSSRSHAINFALFRLREGDLLLEGKQNSQISH